MSGLYELGDKVIISDYLVRACLDMKQIEVLREKWDNAPSFTLHPAVQRPRWNVWVPNSLVDSLGPTAWGAQFVGIKSRYVLSKVETPLEGIVVQEFNLQDGSGEFDEYGMSFCSISTKKGYNISYNLRRKPLKVSLDMMRGV